MHDPPSRRRNKFCFEVCVPLALSMENVDHSGSSIPVIIAQVVSWFPTLMTASFLCPFQVLCCCVSAFADGLFATPSHSLTLVFPRCRSVSESCVFFAAGYVYQPDAHRVCRGFHDCLVDHRVNSSQFERWVHVPPATVTVVTTWQPGLVFRVNDATLV